MSFETEKSQPLSSNRELQLAWDFAEHTGSNIFLTGRAGTGKTTFLKTFQTRTAKRMIVTAPTGVAAINAGGVTLHSFFQLPFGPFVPGSEAYEAGKNRQYRFSKEKRRIIQTLDLLVIDEISMVRSDLLDSVDAVLRRLRRSTLPFGGVQLFMIGDLHQLSPVAKQAEWQILSQFYESIYFFSSSALGQTRLVTIELKHIFRQSDQTFIKILNQVRDNTLDRHSVQMLNQRCFPDFVPEQNQGYITLTTHNRKAEAVNTQKLAGIPGTEFSFAAEISGEFPGHVCPAPETLRLKKGAQVMFLRNDGSGEKRYYNGRIGKITAISQKSIKVLCPGDAEEIIVEPLAWENIAYGLDETTKEIQEKVIGKFEQYPLKPAWAITIHKSQGLTFDRAVIDAGQAFTHGQVYVALSRCKTLEGMVLSSQLVWDGLEPDPAVVAFNTLASKDPPSQSLLEAAKITWQQQLLLDCFDFQSLGGRLNYLVQLAVSNPNTIHVAGVSDLSGVQQSVVRDIVTVGEKFRHQLTSIFSENSLPESHPYTLERLGKASLWFQGRFDEMLSPILDHLYLETDNASLKKKITAVLNNLKKDIMVKLAAVKSLENGFSSTKLLKAMAKAELDFQPDKGKKEQVSGYTEADIDHPELFTALRQWRAQKAEELAVPHFQVMHQRVLIQIAVTLPDSLETLGEISGVGKKTIERYGRELVEIVSLYCRENKIDPHQISLPGKKDPPGRGSPEKGSAKKKDTKQISLDMFNTSMTPEEIAKERGLVVSTIEGHLAYFIEQGR
ncbi:MAG: HRDC domain-containing protein, partial [Thermodesulfobacteriota bacterium]|nr:HRDC domain-containing protein [Thermodesulfobacteriota bacterium]